VRAYPELEDWACDLFYPASRNVANMLIVSPAKDADLSGFKDVVFLDTPSDFNIASLSKKHVYVNGEICGYTMFEKVPVSRERLLDIFATIRREVAVLDGENAEDVANRCGGLGFDKLEFIFALTVFEELGLVSFADGSLTVYRGVKAELTDSETYCKVRALQGN
jgi:ssDNA-specific exonuclease RecJ